MFTESNTVEQMILDAAAKLGDELRSAQWAIRAKVAGLKEFAAH